MSIADNAQAHALLIDGQDVPSAATRTVYDPATGEPIAEVADATAADAERAVAAARAAFRSGVWSRITPAERAAVLDRMADLLEERADEFARTESRNTGKPLKFSSAFDVPLTIDNLRFFAAAARNLEGKASGEYLEGLTSTIRREPIGVCASIAPWNYPLNMAAWKIGPALAAGNTVVLKPAELTPLTALMLGRLALDAGLPPGVLNVVPGPGPRGRRRARPPRGRRADLGHRLHPHRRERHARGRRAPSSACTWSSAARRRSSCSTTPTSRRPPRARSSARSPTAARTARPRRASTSHDRVRDAFLERFLHKVDRLVVGDPMDDATNLGPLVSSPSAIACTASSSAPGRRGHRRARRRAAGRARRVLPADRDHRRRAGLRDRPERGLRPGRLRARLRGRRRGVREGQRHALRPGRVGLDARRLPRPARRARARGRHGLDQRAPRDRLGDAPRRGQGVRLRQGHVHVRARGVHGDQARRLRAHRALRERSGTTRCQPPRTT